MELKDSLFYRQSFRTGRATKRSPISKKKEKKRSEICQGSEEKENKRL